MLALEHPLKGIETVQDVLATLIAKDIDPDELGSRTLVLGVPVEYVQFLVQGLARDREKRFRSVEEMERKLRDILSGKITAYCHISLTKKAMHNFMHWLDRNPKQFSMILLLATLGTVATMVWLVVRAVVR
jgi:hypothetical protein